MSAVEFAGSLVPHGGHHKRGYGSDEMDRRQQGRDAGVEFGGFRMSWAGFCLDLGVMPDYLRNCGSCSHK